MPDPEYSNSVWAKLDQILDSLNKQNVQTEKLSGQIDLVKLKVDMIEQRSVFEKQNQDKQIERIEAKVNKIEEDIEPLKKEMVKSQVIFAIIASGALLVVGFLQQVYFRMTG